MGLYEVREPNTPCAVLLDWTQTATPFPRPAQILSPPDPSSSSTLRRRSFPIPLPPTRLLPGRVLAAGNHPGSPRPDRRDAPHPWSSWRPHRRSQPLSPTPLPALHRRSPLRGVLPPTPHPRNQVSMATRAYSPWTEGWFYWIRNFVPTFQP
jgi:hypothetical protein